MTLTLGGLELSVDLRRHIDSTGLRMNDAAARRRRSPTPTSRRPPRASRAWRTARRWRPRSQFDALAGCEAFFKCENLQRMGAFKFRGAYNALSRARARRQRAAAWSRSRRATTRRPSRSPGSCWAFRATIVMPADAPAVKVAATRGYGAEVVLYDRAAGQNREQFAAKIAAERGRHRRSRRSTIAHVIAGQGTAAKELLEDVGPLDYLFVCCGGAGLLSGCAVAARHLSPGIKVVGVEPAAGDDAARSFRTKTLQTRRESRTPSPTARAPQSMGALTFPLVLRERRTTSSPSPTRELVEAMRFLWERMKLVVEPTGALADRRRAVGRDRRARRARRHHPVRRQRRPEGDRRALRVSALPMPERRAIPRRGSALWRWFGRAVLRAARLARRGRAPRPAQVRDRRRAAHLELGFRRTARRSMFALDLRIAFIGKHTIFRVAVRRVLRWMGGIPVDRSRAPRRGGRVVEAFAQCRAAASW